VGYLVAVLVACACLAVAASYATREPSKTVVPAIQLESVQLIEPPAAAEPQRARQRKKKADAKRGAAPAQAPASVPAGDDDGDDESEGDDD
jgi:hypothetical protein